MPAGLSIASPAPTEARDAEPALNRGFDKVLGREYSPRAWNRRTLPRMDVGMASGGARTVGGTL